MLAALDANALLSGAIPAVMIVSVPALARVLKNRRTSRRGLHSRVSTLESALLGTKDMRGRSNGDGLLDRVDRLDDRVKEVQEGVQELLLNNGHGKP